MNTWMTTSLDVNVNECRITAGKVLPLLFDVPETSASVSKRLPTAGAAMRDRLDTNWPASEKNAPAGVGTVFGRYPVAAGSILMFALTRPPESGLVAQSRGLLLFVGLVLATSTIFPSQYARFSSLL
jgi:hypothetical protein